MKKILVVEDDILYSAILVAELHKLGLETRASLDGEAAIVNLDSYVPDLLLLDLLLPKQDGYQVLKRMKINPQTAAIPVIVLSNLGEAQDIERAHKIGISVYIVKSAVTPPDVAKKVKELVADI